MTAARRILAMVIAIVASVFAIPASHADTTPVVAAGYQGIDGAVTLRHDQWACYTAPERGPPGSPPTTTIYDAVNRWSHGASARPDAATPRTITTYDYLAALAHFARVTASPQGHPAAIEAHSVAPAPAGVAANAGRGALNLPFKDPALRSQVDDVVRHFDEFGAPPPGVAQGGLKGYPKGTYGNKNGALPNQSVGYYTESDIWTSGNSVKRGAERLIFGDGGEVYYSFNHYELGSFVRI